MDKVELDDKLTGDSKPVQKQTRKPYVCDLETRKTFYLPGTKDLRVRLLAKDLEEPLVDIRSYYRDKPTRRGVRVNKEQLLYIMHQLQLE